MHIGKSIYWYLNNLKHYVYLFFYLSNTTTVYNYVSKNLNTYIDRNTVTINKYTTLYCLLLVVTKETPLIVFANITKMLIPTCEMHSYWFQLICYIGVYICVIGVYMRLPVCLYITVYVWNWCLYASARVSILLSICVIGVYKRLPVCLYYCL